jgi:HPt (histidine-containing phosphotransfer) domain-containing protein
MRPNVHRTASDATLVAERLADLADDTGMTVDELRTMWVTETSERLEHAVSALTAGALSEAVRLVHTAAGTTGLCGAVQLAKNLASIEHMAAEGRGTEAGKALLVARADFTRLTSVLQGRQDP